MLTLAYRKEPDSATTLGLGIASADDDAWLLRLAAAVDIRGVRGLSEVSAWVWRARSAQRSAPTWALI
jgi:hypothetical protein